MAKTTTVRVDAETHARLLELGRAQGTSLIETVEADPEETTGHRRCLNLGHTLGHALEACSGFTIQHGPR